MTKAYLVLLRTFLFIFFASFPKMLLSNVIIIFFIAGAKLYFH